MPMTLTQLAFEGESTKDSNSKESSKDSLTEESKEPIEKQRFRHRGKFVRVHKRREHIQPVFDDYGVEDAFESEIDKSLTSAKQMMEKSQKNMKEGFAYARG